VLLPNGVTTAPPYVSDALIILRAASEGEDFCPTCGMLRPVVVLVPRQLRMNGMTGPVPYYGGRFTPAQAYAASHPAPPSPPPPPPPPRRDPVEALDELLESGVITEAEHQQLCDRLKP
jgi:hypothetical protein